MNIQIYGKNKCFDTKKAERWFKERGIRFQSVDLLRVGMSAGELQSVLRAVGGIDALLDPKARDAAVVRYLARDEDKLERLLSDPYPHPCGTQRPAGHLRLLSRGVEHLGIA